MKFRFIPFLFIVSLSFADIGLRSGGDTSTPPTSFTTPPPDSLPTPPDSTANLGQIKCNSGSCLMDGEWDVSKTLKLFGFEEFVGISTPIAPPSNHARLYLSSNTADSLCSEFSDASVLCIGSSTGSISGLGLSATDPIHYSSGTGSFSLGHISESTGTTGGLPMLDIRTYNPTACTNSSHDDASLFTALDTTTSGYLLINSTGCYINSNITLSNPLYFTPGASLNGSGTLTLTVPPVSPAQKIFNNTGLIQITQANVPLRAEWWGAISSAGVTTSASVDSSVAFSSADYAAPNGGTIEALAGHYKMNKTVTITNTNLVGVGKWKTIFEPGSAMMYYSTMTMFSMNGHYNHYESFQVNSEVASSSFTVILSSNGAGGERVRDLNMFYVGCGLAIPSSNNGHFEDIFMYGVSTGIYTGGSTGLFAGDDYFDNIVIVNYLSVSQGGTGQPPGVSFIMDKNSSAFYISNLTTLGGHGGVWIRGSTGTATAANYSGSDAAPSNMFFHHPVINNSDQFGVRIDRNYQAMFDDGPIIDGMSGTASAFDIRPSTPYFVDGVNIYNAKVDGNGSYGVDFAGCNLEITGGEYFAEAVSSAGIHIGSNSCGLIKLQNLMAGTTIYGNASSAQAYGIQIDNILISTTNSTGSSFVGRLMVTNNMLAGNATAPCLDNDTLPDNQRTYSGNYTGNSPAFSCGANTASASSFAGALYTNGEVISGAIAGLGNTREIYRGHAGTDGNVLLTGPVTLATGGAIWGMTDSNTLAPLQLRGSKVYWNASDGNIGINNSNPLSLFHMSSGTLSIDGSTGELVVGKSAGLGTTREMLRISTGTDQNLVLTGAQTLSSGGNITSYTDAAALAPLQLRGSQFYWNMSDGKVGFGATSPDTTVGVQIATSAVVGGTGGLASGDMFRVQSGSMTVDGLGHFGTVIISSTVVSATTSKARCSAGMYVIGGGCQGSNTTVPLAGFPDSTTTFTCSSGSSENVVSWAVCARIQ